MLYVAELFAVYTYSQIADRKMVATNLLCRILVLLSSLKYMFAIDNVCYPIVGCFLMSAPWRTTLRPLPPPASPDVINTRFYLYTRGQPTRYDVIKEQNITLDGSDYDGAKKTFIFTHGFMSNGARTWVIDLKNALLDDYDCNVFVVDWREGARNASYLQVASNTRVVGAELIRLGQYLISSKDADPSRFHLMGHSLGAHVSSYMAKAIPNIGRITAFDPAQPGFERYPKQVRLDSSDAIFVDVIHTSSMGMVGSVGHVDFYMNGGLYQPGCTKAKKSHGSSSSLSDLAKTPLRDGFDNLLCVQRSLDIFSIVDALSSRVKCEHGRSYIYFIESLREKNCNFWGRKVRTLSFTASVLSGGKLSRYFSNLDRCTIDTCSPLGMESINYPARGSFLVATSQQPPFCRPETDARMLEFHLDT